MESTYFWFCTVMFFVGIVLLGLGTFLKERIPPRAAAAMIVVGLILAMVFMNLVLFMQMMSVKP